MAFANAYLFLNFNCLSQKMETSPTLLITNQIQVLASEALSLYHLPLGTDANWFL